MERFSDTLSKFSGEIENPVLRDSLKSLEQLVEHELLIMEWGDSKIAVPIEVKVNLPSLGNYDGIDIREREPITLVFDLNDYPTIAPMAFTDRLDFPKDNLAHLYVATNGRPPAFCFIRGSINDWYANKRIEDLIIRLSNWFRDAVTGDLVEDGEQFEPLRLDGYSGTIVYDYNTIMEIINRKTVYHFGERIAIALFERPKQKEGTTFKFCRALTIGNALDTIKEVDKEKKKGKEDVSRKNYHYAYIIWNEEADKNKNYVVNLPRNWEEFKAFCSYYNIDIQELETFIATIDGNSFIHFPVIVGIKRPRPLIGYSSSYEFINFRFWIDIDDIKEGKIVNNVAIDFFAHNQPLTRELASQISDFKLSSRNRTVVFGCGALGSKVVVHIARAGYTNFTLIDPDKISPHNLVRHALYGDDVGENKAKALVEKIRKMYPYETNTSVGGPSFKEGLINKKETFEKTSWVLDFTASDAFFNKLVSITSLDEKNVVSASISDFGNLGILFKEGKARNPRIDDLQVYLFSLALHDEKIENWLQREEQANRSNNLTIKIGIGCNSETTNLSDDKISSHSSYFSGVLKKEMKIPFSEGKIYLNWIHDGEDYVIETQSYPVKSFTQISAMNDRSWVVRFKSSIIESIRNELIEAGESETGGVFVGVCNYKTKAIHVVGTIDSPPDSYANPIKFIRGKEGLAEEIQKINKVTGGQIGYIGEWHTHPTGPHILSVQDLNSIAKNKAELSQLNPPLPVFVCVVTPEGLYPYIY